jgi:hypothetical protein
MLDFAAQIEEFDNQAAKRRLRERLKALEAERKRLRAQVVEAPSKKRGRPSKWSDGPSSRMLTFRTRDGLRERLQLAAGKSGRSVSEEIEYRLMLSFEREKGQQGW